MSESIINMLRMSEEDVRFDKEKNQYLFGDAILRIGQEAWYLIIINPQYPEIFKVNGWEESTMDIFLPIWKIAVKTQETSELLKQLKVIIRYVRGIKKSKKGGN